MPKFLGPKEATFTGEDSLEMGSPLVRFSRTYIVMADTTDDDEEDIVATTGIPALYAVLKLGARCVGRRAREVSHIIHPVTGVPSALWEVECTFDSKTDATGAMESQFDPPLRTPEIQWSSEILDRRILRDVITGDFVYDGAKNWLDIQAGICIPVLRITRWEYFPYDPFNILNYVNSLNSQDFWGAPPGTALMTGIDVNSEVENGELYNKAVYTIKFRMEPDPDAPGDFRVDSWQFREVVWSKYYMELDGLNWVRKEVAEETGDKEPVMIYQDTGERWIGPPSDPPTHEFNFYGYLDFNYLNLGPYA